MPKFKITIFLFFLAITSMVGYAQPTKPPIAKPLKLVSKFGPYADSSRPFATDLKQAIKIDLKVTDSNGGSWTVVSYRLGWRKKDMSDDVRTGKRKVVFLFNATSVNNSSKIPESWQKELQLSLQPTEQLLFEEIIVQDLKTKKMMKAPPVRLFIQ